MPGMAVKAAVVAGVVVVGAGVLLITVASEALGLGGNTGVVCGPVGSTSVAGFAGDQLANATVIVGVGKSMGVPERGWVIAVATAMQESSLHNDTSGDRDSVGLFQQRPSQGWGTAQQIEVPSYAATQFYDHLVQVPNWESLPLTVAAQDVQRSATPDAYAKWEQDADQVVGVVEGVQCQSGGSQGGVPAYDPAQAQAVIRRALTQVGVPYVWGGGNAEGPTGGGFDCSGLMVYAFAGVNVTVPHQTQAIWQTFGPPITDPSQVEPGDMLLLSSNGKPSGIHHVGMYLGNGEVVDAPETGKSVEVLTNIWGNSYWRSQFIGAVRVPSAATTSKPGG